MPGATATALPSLSLILGWHVEHLSRAATDWRGIAEHWESAFDGIHQGTLAPGGTAWEGATADAAQERAFSDLVKVRGLADALIEAATIARYGAEQLDYLKRRAIEAVNDAREAGFSVGEDLSVTDTAEYSELRIALVRQHAAKIASSATELKSADDDIAARISIASAKLDGTGFDESVEAVHALDVPLAPAPDPGAVGDGGVPNGPEIRGVVDQLPQGNKPWIREVRAPEDLERLWNWMRQNGAEVPNGYGNPAKGNVVVLPDGTRVGQRFAADSNGKPVLDIQLPTERGNTKIHINPRGGVPAIPAPIRGGVPGGFGGAPLPDGMLPSVIQPRQAGDPDLPVVGDGIPDDPPF